MTKFEELCQVFTHAKDDFEKYKSDCAIFAENIWNNLISYYQIPHDNISLYRLNEEGKFELIIPSMFKALVLMQDARWSFAVGVTLQHNIAKEMEDVILISFFIRKDAKQNYYISSNFIQQESLIKLENNQDYYNYFDKIFTIVVDNYTNEFNEFTQQKNIRQIGFKKDATEAQTNT
jgi:hypothetical protein